jgi:hypothetical protein
MFNSGGEIRGGRTELALTFARVATSTSTQHLPLRSRQLLPHVDQCYHAHAADGALRIRVRHSHVAVVVHWS